MSDTATIQLRKFIRNPLLKRKQCIVDVLHPNKANLSKKDIATEVGKYLRAKEENVVVFGMRTAFGGGKSSGFALIYDNQEVLKQFEPKHRLVRAGILAAPEGSKKNRSETKQRGKKVRGTGVRLAKKKARRSQD